jgi:hypothetical protein
MGKRSDFARIERDFYPTPKEAVAPLLPSLSPGTRFIEPCAGDGRLVEELSRHGHVLDHAADIEPRAPYVFTMDARDTKYRPAAPSIFITNPPWDRKLLHPIIENLSSQAPTWLLFDADWIHTRQSAPYARFLRKIVSVGRVKWIADSPFTGKDNCAWHLFTNEADAPALFIGRAA